MVFLIGCGNKENGNETVSGNEKSTTQSILGTWQCKFDVSNAEPMTMGLLSQSKFEYIFKNDNKGERNVTAMGMEANVPTTWSMSGDTIYIDYTLFKKDKEEMFVFVEKDKMKLVDESEEVITYLVLKVEP